MYSKSHAIRRAEIALLKCQDGSIKAARRCLMGPLAGHEDSAVNYEAALQLLDERLQQLLSVGDYLAVARCCAKGQECTTIAL